MSRLFIAVWPPPRVRHQIEALPRHEQRNIRWVPPDRWHITLRFVGDAAPDDVSRRLDGLRFEPAVITLGPQVSRFGRSLVVVPARGVEQLAKAVIDATADLGQAPDPRPFAGHITLARLQGRAACGVAGAPISSTFLVDEVTLVDSVQSSSGLRYETVGAWAVPGC